ncbi:MAG: hypothetical protein AB7I50_07930 [Vicinamibacterales bacterium]
MSEARTPVWMARVERRPVTVLIVIGALCWIAYTASLVFLPKTNGRIVVGDAVHYYVYLRSLVFDGDLRFQNDYVALYGLRGGEPDTEWVYAETETGHTRNLMSVGPALIWAPLYVGTTAAIWLARLMGVSYPFDGFGRLFQATAGWSGLLAATAGAVLAFGMAARLIDRRSALWATLSVWLGTSAIYYTAISPTYSHAASMLTVSLFLYAWVRTRDVQTPARYAMVGALGGLAALVRWQDAIFLVVPVVDAVWQAIPLKKWGRLVGNVAACGTASVLTFSPQLAAWWRIYGHPLLVPQGEGFMRWSSPALVDVLFSDFHGLFSWSPVLLFAIVGLPALARRDRLVGVVAIVCLTLSWYANAAAADWWAGEAFGARRFVSCFPLFVVGMAAWLARWQDAPRRLVVFCVVFIALNFLLLLQYQAFLKGLRHLVPYPRGFEGLVVGRFTAPFKLAAWFWSNLTT